MERIEYVLHSGWKTAHWYSGKKLIRYKNALFKTCCRFCNCCFWNEKFGLLNLNFVITFYFWKQKVHWYLFIFSIYAEKFHFYSVLCLDSNVCALFFIQRYDYFIHCLRSNMNCKKNSILYLPCLTLNESKRPDRNNKRLAVTRQQVVSRFGLDSTSSMTRSDLKLVANDAVSTWTQNRYDWESTYGVISCVHLESQHKVFVGKMRNQKHSQWYLTNALNGPP